MTIETINALREKAHRSLDAARELFAHAHYDFAASV